MLSERDSNRDAGNMAFVTGLFTGMAIGAGIGLLFAPRAGSELRGQIVDSASAVGRKVSETIDAVSDSGRDAYHQARDVAATAGNELGRMATEAGKSAEKGVAAVRNAATTARTQRPDFSPRV